MAPRNPGMGGFEIDNIIIAPGTRGTVEIDLSVLSNHVPARLPVHVMHGKRAGPVIFVSAAIHGDEVLGVEIIRRLIKTIAKRRISGTLLFIPVVNTYGFIGHSRYLPDRRDLNRSFPGASNGSLASRLAQTFMGEIVERSDFGIDLHTGAIHRANLPQIRADLSQGNLRHLAGIFGAPAVLNADLRDGSLRQAAQEIGCNMLLYEAGEALRFDEYAIRVGYRGVMNVLRELNVIGGKKNEARTKPVFSNASHWERAPDGGLLRAFKRLGDGVEKGDILGIVSDPMGETEIPVTAREPGIVIGRTNLPVVNQGDGLFHIASVVDPDKAVNQFERHEKMFDDDPGFSEEEIV